MEIERKFLLSAIPKEVLENIWTKHYRIEVIYVAVVKNDKDEIEREIRVRRFLDTDKPDKITVKSGGDIIREEIEEILPDGTFFDKLEKMTECDPIIKDFYWMPCGSYNLELTHVDPGRETSFIYAEVEFSSIEEAKQFQWPFPEILSEEVTYEPKYRMANYWTKTRNML